MKASNIINDIPENTLQVSETIDTIVVFFNRENSGLYQLVRLTREDTGPSPTDNTWAFINLTSGNSEHLYDTPDRDLTVSMAVDHQKVFSIPTTSWSEYIKTSYNTCVAK